MARFKKTFTKKRKSMGISKTRKVRGGTITKIKKQIKTLQTGQEYKYLAYSKYFDIFHFLKGVTQVLPPSYFQLLSVWPGQGLTASTRDGKSMRNVKQTFMIKLQMYSTYNTSPQVATNQIPFLCYRVVIWTADEYWSTGSIPDFWKVNDNITDIELLPINRAKVIVLYDKTFRKVNPYYNNTYTPPLVANTAPIFSQVRINFSRRWKSVTFQADVSVTPTDNHKYTYLSVFSEPISTTVASTSAHGTCAVLSKLYWLN